VSRAEFARTELTPRRLEQLQRLALGSRSASIMRAVGPSATIAESEVLLG